PLRTRTRLRAGLARPAARLASIARRSVARNNPRPSRRDDRAVAVDAGAVSASVTDLADRQRRRDSNRQLPGYAAGAARSDGLLPGPADGAGGTADVADFGRAVRAAGRDAERAGPTAVRLGRLRGAAGVGRRSC